MARRASSGPERVGGGVSEVAYYYFLASLPSLSLDGPPPPSPARFAAACAHGLSSAERAHVTAALEGRAETSLHPALQEWAARETQLRNAVARHRAARLRREREPGTRPHAGFDVCLERGVADVMGRPDPLERERALEELRWRIADDLARPDDPFGFAAVLRYALHLRMAWRWETMRPEEGERVLGELIEENLDRLLRRIDWGERHGG